ncbi:MAG: peptidylprolyl isomerase [Candidatus Doudnabacteria bacterium]|nr:peptidylprolyl isomerase [Candidatus Doudnabacteria bacterium]
MGTFEITLEDKATPKTVANFIKLSNNKFYENLTFHRIVKQTGFHLIQGGDPKGDGSGGPGYTIPAEIGLKHTKGAVATARTADQINPEKASSGSQFYIVEEDIPFLDGNYTVFGYVTKGMDVVEKIGKVPTGENDKPLTAVTIKKITIK